MPPFEPVGHEMVLNSPELILLFIHHEFEKGSSRIAVEVEITKST
jgi:hypothetical protein